MGQRFAGILGPLAFLAVLVREMAGGGTAETATIRATMALVTFAVLGFVLGSCGGWIVKDSVQAQIAQQLSAQDARTGNVSEPARGR